MKALPDTQTLNHLFSVDFATGQLFWKNPQAYNVFPGTEITGRSGKGYLRVAINKVRYLAHRIVYAMYHGDCPDGLEIDHINGVKDDNRIENLRLVTTRENCCNRGNHRNGKLYGCRQNKSTGKWQALAHVGKKHVCLGSYVTELEAHEVYKKYIASMEEVNPT
jgi:hypothetical protein